MKRILIIFTTIIIILNLSIVKAASNPYKKTSSYGTNCTWYAWKMAYEKGGVALPGWGNAKDWYKDAKKDGYKVGSIPKANSIVVWSNWTSYGHVGYVEKVSEDTLHVWDSTGPCIDREDEEYKECEANSINEDTSRVCLANAKRIACEYSISKSDYNIAGYIYLDEKPSKKQESTDIKKPSESNSSKEEEPQQKSNNAYLKDLTIENFKIQFSKEKTNYKIEVPSNISEINVIANPEDKTAKIIGTGKYNLQEGHNEITISVTAEDQSIKEYKINIYKKQSENKNIITKEPKEKKNISQKIIYIIITTIILIVPIIIIIIKKIRQKKVTNCK